MYTRHNSAELPLRISVLTLLVLMCSLQTQPLSILNKPARENQLWNCNFDKNACHFRNQYNLARFNRFYSPTAPFYGQRSVLVLDLSTQNARKFPGARLISHYFPAKYSNACLYINYLLVGSAPRAFYVIQQDKENKCIFADENEQRTNSWRQVQLQLDLTDGDPRFFIEAQYETNLFNRQEMPGYIAVSLFSYSFGNCERNQANNCFADMNNLQVPSPK